MTFDLRRWMNAVSPLTTLTEAAAIPTLYRGFGSGKGQRYKGKEWGDAVYLTSDLQIATWYGQQGGVKRAHVPRLHVISASDAMTEQIADSVSPSTTARRLGVDAIYNASKHWVNRISPYEFILFAKDQVSFSPLSSEETAEYDRVKALLSEAPRDLRRWIMLCERWETLGEAVDAALLQGIDLTSFDRFLASLKRVPREQVTGLQTVLNQLNDQTHRPHPGYIELYHGAPEQAADNIRQQGFQLTKGQRTGPSFAGLEWTDEVDNQGIFLTDSKPLARYFGSNRSRYGNDWTMFTCYVDASTILDANAVTSGPLVKLGLKLVNEYNGSNLRRLPEREWWWLLDQPPFVDAIKAQGYTGVRFRESRAVRRLADTDAGHTYLIFDPSTIRLKGRDSITIEKFYQWLVNQSSHIMEAE